MALRGGTEGLVGSVDTAVRLGRGARGAGATQVAWLCRMMKQPECSWEQPSVIQGPPMLTIARDQAKRHHGGTMLLAKIQQDRRYSERVVMQRILKHSESCLLIVHQIHVSLATLSSVSSSMGRFIRAARYGLILPALFMLTACVSVRVEPLTHESYPPRPRGEVVQWLETEPGSPHVELARIIATSQSADEDRLRDKILARASVMGADAVVLGKSDVLESMGSSPRYQSTMGPGSGGFGVYGGGWWNYYDPWSYVQGSADQIGRTEYLSGTAIRYVEQKTMHH
jgi:hypothetical protein